MRRRLGEPLSEDDVVSYLTGSLDGELAPDGGDIASLDRGKKCSGHAT